jgi:protein-S-isoprenylcysteine O-methyltransferase Ste14
VSDDPPILAMGNWLFKNRGWLPIPLVIGLYILRFNQVDSLYLTWLPGALLIVLGLAIRFWAVGYISTKSRTYSDETWYLQVSGPYAWSRNPLYVGNCLLWIGVTLSSGLLWALPIIALLFFLEYNLIITWEENNLAKAFGTSYQRYLGLIPRWIPHPRSFTLQTKKDAIHKRNESPGTFSWIQALSGEKHTWLSVIGAILLMVTK